MIGEATRIGRLVFELIADVAKARGPLGEVAKDITKVKTETDKASESTEKWENSTNELIATVAKAVRAIREKSKAAEETKSAFQSVAKTQEDLGKSTQATTGLFAKSVQQFAAIKTALSSVATTAKVLATAFSATLNIAMGVFLSQFALKVIEKIEQLANALYNAAKQADIATTSFRLMAEHIGADADRLTENMLRASKGIVDMTNVMTMAGRAMQSGLNPEELTVMMEIATRQAKVAGVTVAEAFNIMSYAATSGYTRGLRQLGIVIDTTKAMDRYAAAIGTEASALTREGQAHAVVLALMERDVKTKKDLSSATLTNSEELEKFYAHLSNLSVLLGGPAYSLVNNWIKAFNMTADAIERANDSIKSFNENLRKLGPLAEKLPKSGGYNALGVPMGVTGSERKDQENFKKTKDSMDEVEAALLKTTRAMAEYTAQMQLGGITSEEFVKRIDQEIVGLQLAAVGLETNSDKYRKLADAIRNLTVQRAQLTTGQVERKLTDELRAIQQNAEVALNLVRENVAGRTMLVEQGATEELRIRLRQAQQEAAAVERTLQSSTLSEERRIAFVRQAEDAKARVRTLTSQLAIDADDKVTKNLQSSLVDRLRYIQTNADAELRAVKVAMSARAMSVEEGTLEEARIRLEAAEKEKAERERALREGSRSLDEAIAKRHAYEDAAKAVAERTAEYEIAKNRLVTRELLIEMDRRRAAIEQESKIRMQAIDQEEAETIAMYENVGGGVLEAARSINAARAKADQERYDAEMDALNQQRNALISDRAQGLIEKDAYEKQLLAFESRALDISLKHKQAASARKLAIDRASAAEYAAEQAGINAAEKARQDAITAIWVANDAVRLNSMKRTIDRIDEILRTSEMSEEVRQAFLTMRYQIQLDQRVQAFILANQSMELALQRSTRTMLTQHVADWIEARTTLVDITRETGLAMFEAETDLIQKRATFEERAIQASLDRTMAIKAEAGNIGGYFEAAFAKALTAGRDMFSTMAQLAADTAQSIQNVFSDLIFEFLEQRLENMADVIRNWASQIKRAIANALSNMLTSAIGNLFGGGAQGVAALAVQAQKVALTFQNDLAPAALAAAVALGKISGTAPGAAATGGNALDQALSATGGGGGLSSLLSGGASLLGGVKSIFSGLTSAFNAVDTAWTMFNATMGAGHSIITAASSAVQAFGTAVGDSVGSLIGGATPYLAALTIAANVVTSVMDLIEGKNKNAAYGTLAGTAAGAIAGGLLTWWTGPGAIIGALIGGALGGSAGGMLGGLFGEKPPKWQRELDELADAFATITPMIDALQTTQMSMPQLIDKLSKLGDPRFWGSMANAFVTSLNLPAGEWGPAGKYRIVAPGTEAHYPGEQVISDPEMIRRVLMEHPEVLESTLYVGIVTGKALEEKAKLQDAIEEIIVSMVERASALADLAKSVETDLADAAKTVLPTDVFEGFKRNTIEPLVAYIETLMSGGKSIEEVNAALDLLKPKFEALAKIFTVYGIVTKEIAAMSGDRAALTKQELDSYNFAMKAINDRITQIKNAITTQTVGIEDAIAREIELHDLVAARYALEIQMVQMIEERIASMIQTFGQSFLDTQSYLLNQNIIATSGSLDVLGQAFNAYVQMATSAVSSALRGFAIGAAMQTGLGAIPAWVQATNRFPDIGAVSQALQPVFDVLSQFITDAIKAGDLSGALALSQQQAAYIVQMRDATIAGIQQAAQQWTDIHQQRIKDLQDEYEIERKIHDDRIEALQLEIKGWSDQIELLRESADDRLRVINDELELLSEELELVREWESALKNIQDLMDDMRMGAESILSPMDQLIEQTAKYQAALSEFMLGPTAERANVLRDMAAALFAQGKEVFDPASAAYQEFYAEIMDDLRMVSEIVEQNLGGRTVASLEDRIDALREEAESISKATAQAVEELQDLIDAANNQIDAERDIIDQMTKDTEAKIKKIQEDIDAVNDTAKELIKQAVAHTDALLASNAKLQGDLFMRLVGTQEQLLLSVTGGKPAQIYLAERAKETVNTLVDIRNRLDALLMAAGIVVPSNIGPSPQPPENAQGAPPAKTPQEPEEPEKPHTEAALLPPITINVYAAANAQETANEVVGKLARELKPGGALRRAARIT